MSINATESYHDLLKEIDVLEVRLSDLEWEYKFLYKACFNGNKKPFMRLHLLIERMNEICNLVEMYTTIREEKEKTKRQMEERMSEFEGIDYKVAYMRDIEYKSLMEISMELGYSYHWIAKISSRIGKNTAKRVQESIAKS